MKRIAAVGVALWLVCGMAGQARAFDLFGESGYFITPTTNVVPKGAVNFGGRWVRWPTRGKDLWGGGLVAGIAKNLEFGYGHLTRASGDRNSFGLKYRVIKNKDTGFQAALGGQFAVLGGSGRNQSDQKGLAYAVIGFPFPYGTINVGGMWGPDQTKNNERKTSAFGSVNYFMYPDIEFYYEIAQISRVNGELFHSFGVNYRPTDKQPIWLHFGGLSGVFETGRGTETAVTAGITLGYNEKQIFKREEGSF